MTAATTHAGRRANPLIVGGCTRFTVIHPNCIRIEHNPDGTFVDEPSLFAIHRNARCPDFQMTDDGREVVIDTGAIRLRYLEDGKALGPRNLSARIRRGEQWVVWKPGLRNRANLGGTAETLDAWTGARALDDGLLSRDGWYLLDDSTGPLQVDGWVAGRSKQGRDWYLFGYGRDYRAAFQAFAAIASKAPMPRRYTLGSWYSRYWPYSSDDFRQIVEEYTKKDFPLDMIVMDMDWHITNQREAFGPDAPPDGQVWTGFTWDRKLLPDAEELLKWFHREGVHVTLNDHPADGVQPHEAMYRAFMRDMGTDPKSRQTLPFDAGNRRYLETFYRHTHTPMEEAGVDFWWLDWQQSRFTPSVPTLKNLAWLNNYYYRCSQRDGNRGQSFSRWGGWGDHRHPIHFSGDANTGWDMLAFEVPFTATAGNVGCFFWSHDIGGHMGGRNEEAYTRWCQFGALSAALRSHSTREASMDRRPWTYPKWAEASMRRSFHLRSELFPCIYSNVAQSCSETIPLTRPMYLSCPDMDEAYCNPQQYLFGEHLLVAPVAEPGIGPRKLGRQAVWFPPGVWYNFFTGERFAGGVERLVAADIDEFPLFARGGAPIAMQPYTSRMTTTPIRDLVVRCWPGADGSAIRTELYEDDGQTDGYSRGQQALTALAYARNGDAVTVTISPTHGTFSGQLSKRACTIELPATLPASEATVDGRAVTATYDSATRTNRIHVPARSIRKGCTVVVRVHDADPATAEVNAFAQRAGLPCPGRQATTRELLAEVMSHGSNEQRELALRALGVGLFGKKEAVYGHPAKPAYYFYAPAGLPIGRQVHVGLLGTGQTLQLVGEKTPLDMAKLTDLLPAPTNELLFPRNGVALTARLKVNGRRVDTSQPVFFAKPYWPFRDNLAPRARVTASSSMDGQPPSAAIDGIVDGIPGDQSREWASRQEKAGAWLKLDWSQPVTVGRILLFDRPNYADHVVAGQILLSDGTVMPVGELPSDGQTPLELNFRPRKIRWLTFVVTSVSATTGWVGLSEIAVFRR